MTDLGAMPVIHEIEVLLLDGQCPSIISSQLGIPVVDVIDDIWICVGRGSLRLSDVIFSFSEEQRTDLKAAVTLKDQEAVMAQIRRSGLTREEVELYSSLRTRQVGGGEMYDLVSDIELAIHEFVRHALTGHYGEHENEWWRLGIPLPIRKKCQTRREEDESPSEQVFAYTDLIDLSEIITKNNWKIFKSRLHERYQINRKRLTSDFVRLNEIRKAVMHPVKRREWTEEDYQFVRRFRECLWKLPATV